MLWNLLDTLDVFAIAWFAVSYYRNCYRQGYRIDVWHINLFLLCVLPNLLMLPFARSDLNGVILGQDLAAVLSELPTVFAITLVGYFSILFGGSFWRLRVGLGLRKSVIPLLSIPTRCSAMLMSSRGLLVFQTMLCVFLQMLVLAIYFSQNGFGFDLRAYTFTNPTLRPVALLVSNYSITIAAHCLARYLDKKEKVLLACTLFLTLGMIFFGARSNLLGIYMGVTLCYLIGLRTRINIFRLAGGASVIVLLLLYLGSVRAGLFSLNDFFNALGFLLLYGNTFSDLRDFAWVYARWDHVLWAGKTYLAAFLAFVPRFASGFRDTWGLGVATVTTVGFDPHEHPGLRPGIFGEGFFNFGVLGVVAVGLMLGIVIRRVDIDVKRALTAPRPSMIKAFASTAPLGVASAFSLTSNFSSLYVLAGIYLFSWFCLRLAATFSKPRHSLAG